MSVDVIREMLRHSQSRGTDRCVMFTLSDAASPDGVSWLPIDPPRHRPDDPNCITFKAKCSKKEAIRAIHAQIELGELEMRKAQRGRIRVNVYRVVVGAIAEADVDYERLPFELDRPFSRGDKLSPRTEQEAVSRAAKRSLAEANGRGDKLSPRQGNGSTSRRGDNSAADGVTSEPGRGDKSDRDEVTSKRPTRARVNRAFGAEPLEVTANEPSLDPSAAEPKTKTQSVPSFEEGSLSTAAAVVGEPAGLIQVLAALKGFRSADIDSIRTIEPLALQLPGKVFEEIVEKAKRRRARNDVGLLVHLLSVAVNERRRAATAQIEEAVEATSEISRLRKDDPEGYVRRLMAWPSIAPPELVADFLTRYVDDEECDRLGELALELRAESPAKQFERWIREFSPSVEPAEAVRQEIDEWCDEHGLDHTERSMLQELAEEARAEPAALKAVEEEAA